ncbi:hypothetical protein [Aquiflexum lacus]|uniref:hypothetical protein n=1 Tax=Aquiflexum lacus TaxID=2483805 RepID=UPI001894E472|nr:hypothetical protein [Aquiflexum lacus]
MSKIIWVCSKTKLESQVEFKLKSIIEFITPDNINPNNPHIKVDDSVAYGILNPKSNIKYHMNSVALGAISWPDTNWHQPLNKKPDGSYAIFRDNKNYSEIITDATGSRTIWYYFNEDNLVVGTSQFSIIKYLGDFEFNQNVIPWMLSTGTLGPDYSWDKRINKIPPDSSLILDKRTWEIELKSNPIEFKVEDQSEEFFEKELIKSLDDTIKSFHIDYNKWVLPLSGGYDSRGILYLLIKNGIQSIKTVTWGLPDSSFDPKSDAFVAKKLAEKYQVDNQFYPVSFSNEPIEKIVTRFIRNGEGRIDHLGGYLDGFKIWKDLHEKGYEGTVRGDQNFGWKKVSSEKDVIELAGILFLEDFSNISKYDFKNQNIQQNLPIYLIKRKGETLSQYKDRIIIEFRLQSMKSALSDLKFAYLEQITPLLTKNILDKVKKHPDHLREGKYLWKKIINKFDKKIDISNFDSIATFSDIYRSKSMVKFLRNKLLEYKDNELFEIKFIEKVNNNLKENNEPINFKEKITLKKIIKRLIPSSFLSLGKEKFKIKKQIDYNRIAMRIVIIITINKLFKN